MNRWLLDGPCRAISARRRRPLLPLALVVDGGSRAAISIVGMIFALVMVFLQLGFRESVRITAVNVFSQLDFDIVLLSPKYHQLIEPGSFPERRLREAEAIPGVVAARPMAVTMALWRCPRPVEPAGRTPPHYQRRELLVLAIDPDDQPFRGPIGAAVERYRDELRLRDRVLLNELSHPDFGWDVRETYDEWELNTQRMHVVGGFPLIRGFGADGGVLCSLATMDRLRIRPPGTVSMGLLTTKATSEAALEEIAGQLRARLPPDVIVRTRKDLLDHEREYWLQRTATGHIFYFGVFVSTIVAAIVTYQVLSNDIRRHQAEYATLKAIGYTNGFLTVQLLTQGLLYAVPSYPLAVAVSLVVYAVTEVIAGIPMVLTADSLIVGLLLTLGATLGSAASCVSRLWAVDPAKLF